MTTGAWSGFCFKVASSSAGSGQPVRCKQFETLRKSNQPAPVFLGLRLPLQNRDVTVPRNSIDNHCVRSIYYSTRNHNSALLQAPACHIFTDLTVIPRESPSPQVGSHVSASSQKVHCVFVAPSTQGLPPLPSLQAQEPMMISMAFLALRIHVKMVCELTGTIRSWHRPPR